MTGHRSVYPSQVLAVSKSASIEVETGHEVRDVHAHYKPREKGLIHTASKVADTIKRLFGKHS